MILSHIDKFIINVDHAIKTIAGKPETTNRENPADNYQEHELSSEEKQLSAKLMRINHAGEVSAQGLYQGQALTAKLPEIRQQMHQSALEENDHLDWCANRCNELNSFTSHFSPFWYAGSFVIGATAGLAGDKWSLGFVAETERQVIKHLDKHLQQLPNHDEKSREILEQMKIDEQHHQTIAQEAGGVNLPLPIKLAMTLTSKVMTKTAGLI